VVGSAIHVRGQPDATDSSHRPTPVVPRPSPELSAGKEEHAGVPSTSELNVGLSVERSLPRSNAMPWSFVPAEFLRGGMTYLPRTPAELGLRERRLMSLVMEQTRLILSLFYAWGVPGAHVCLLALFGCMAAAGVELASARAHPRVWNFTGIPLDPVPDPAGALDAGDANLSEDGEPPIVSTVVPPLSPVDLAESAPKLPLVQVRTEGPLDLSGLVPSEESQPHQL
jgi:hypothetical protein